MTVNDRLQEAIEKYGTPELDNRVTINLDDIPRIAYRAGLDAVQPVPTDEEIEAAIQRLVDRARETGTDDFMTSRKLRDPIALALAAAKTDLLHLIAQQREAAVREALESVKSELRSRIENYPQFDETGRLNALHPGNEIACKMMIHHIDAMLAKEGGDE